MLLTDLDVPLSTKAELTMSTKLTVRIGLHLQLQVSAVKDIGFCCLTALLWNGFDGLPRVTKSESTHLLEVNYTTLCSK